MLQTNWSRNFNFFSLKNSFFWCQVHEQLFEINHHHYQVVIDSTDLLSFNTHTYTQRFTNQMSKKKQIIIIIFENWNQAPLNHLIIASIKFDSNQKKVQCSFIHFEKPFFCFFIVCSVRYDWYVTFVEKCFKTSSDFSSWSNH